MKTIKGVGEMTVATVFSTCVDAIRNNILINRVSQQDKEFHFQNWFQERLESLSLNYEIAGRNQFPDFRIVQSTEGYGIKGLGYPGRDSTYDSNSQVPTGLHNGRTIYYVFGRYPKSPDGDSYPVLDLVICHGDFLNVDHTYVHKNKSVKGFGSFGDILIRDRKMYVVPTPFKLIDGAAHNRTLILPAAVNPGANYILVGELCRQETEELVISYSFNLQSNEINAEKIPNPGAGRKHLFRAWRLNGDSQTTVNMRDINNESNESSDIQIEDGE